MPKCPECGFNSTTDLSSREKQIACLLATGINLTTIAERLSISIKTASTYSTRAQKKLGLSSALQLALYAHSAEWNKH